MARCGDCCFMGMDVRSQMICKRYPPSVYPIGVAPSKLQGVMPQVQTVSMFPMVTADEWCGEFLKKTQG